MGGFASTRFSSWLARWAAVAAAGLAIGVWAPCVSALFTEDVRTEGRIPVDLNGVWLIASTLEFPNGQYTTLAHIYRITHIPIDIAKQLAGTPRPTPAASEEEGRILLPQSPPRRVEGDDVEVMFLDVELPAPIAAKLKKLQDEKREWVPNEDELKLLAEQWPNLKPRTFSEYTRIEYRIVGENNFDDSLKLDEATKGAKAAIIATQKLSRGPGSTGGTIIIVWGVREVSPERLKGTLVRSHLAGAPFPVAVTTNGRFVMYKLADVSRDWQKKASAAPSPIAETPSPTPQRRAEHSAGAE